jgi:hypothetical protein
MIQVIIPSIPCIRMATILHSYFVHIIHSCLQVIGSAPVPRPHYAAVRQLPKTKAGPILTNTRTDVTTQRYSEEAFIR